MSRMVVTIVSLAAVAVSALSSRSVQETTVFVGASVVDAAGVLPSATVLVRDGRIVQVGRSADVSVPDNATRVDLTGRFLVPGLVAAHVHVSDVNGLAPRAYTAANTRRQLEVFARYGITSVVSLGGEQAPAFAARAAQSQPALGRARIFVAGEVLAPTTVEQARSEVARTKCLPTSFRR